MAGEVGVTLAAGWLLLKRTCLSFPLAVVGCACLMPFSPARPLSHTSSSLCLLALSLGPNSMQDWNLDVCMLLLLLAAFAAANALSLMYMLSMAAGMALSNRTQQVGGRLEAVGGTHPGLILSLAFPRCKAFHKLTWSCMSAARCQLLVTWAAGHVSCAHGYPRPACSACGDGWCCRCWPSCCCSNTWCSWAHPPPGCLAGCSRWLVTALPACPAWRRMLR